MAGYAEALFAEVIRTLILMKNQEPISVGIVFPVHNRKDITLQCLKSLSNLNTDGLSVFTVMVDDGSTDGTSDAVRAAYPEVRIVEGDGNLWFTAGTNRGIEAALGENPDFILTINDDAVFDPDFLLRMIKTAGQHERSIIGAALLSWDEPHKVFQVAPEWRVSHGGFRHWNKQTIWTLPKTAWKTDIIVGNCVLFPAEAIRENGMMNEKLFPHFGDAEFTPRMKRNGWQLLVEPRAHVFCQPNDIPPTVRKMDFKTMFNKLFVDLGNTHSLRRRLYANMYGGPGKIQGIAAFAVFFLRLFAGKNAEGAWAAAQPEQPLSERYAHLVVDDKN
jgi:glycosyltransferase involved in cell wall biosynthesis